MPSRLAEAPDRDLAEAPVPDQGYVQKGISLGTSALQVTELSVLCPMVNCCAETMP
jgi:hypothetical protein